MITWSSLLERLQADATSEDPGESLLTTFRGFCKTVRRASRPERPVERDPDFDPDYVPPTERSAEVPATGERVEP